MAKPLSTSQISAIGLNSPDERMPANDMLPEYNAQRGLFAPPLKLGTAVS
jgi:hypothetical protein